MPNINVLSGKHIWPDYIEWWEGDAEVGEASKLCAIIVYHKGNNRPFASDKNMMIRTLEALGLVVELDFNGTRMTLDEFEQGAGYRTQLSAHSKQSLYNSRVELKQLEDQLSKVPEGSQLHFELVKKVEMKKRRLGVMSDLFAGQRSENLKTEQAKEAYIKGLAQKFKDSPEYQRQLAWAAEQKVKEEMGGLADVEAAAKAAREEAAIEAAEKGELPLNPTPPKNSSDKPTTSQ